MRFVAIDAQERKIFAVNADVPQHVYPRVGLDALHVDHATVARSHDIGIGIAIVVFEYGLFAPPAETFYFSLGRCMYAGNAVLYAFDAAGETIDMPARLPPICFYKDHQAVEAAITRGDIDRPQTTVNGAVIWSWPSKN